jgi:prophage antirepressor-like protein
MKDEVVEVKTMKSFEKCTVLGKELTMYGSLEEPLFLAKDVAEWIEYSKTSNGSYNVAKLLMSVDEDEKIKSLCNVINCNINGGNTTSSDITSSNSASKMRNTQEMWFLTENGLYEVLMQSRKPIAKSFKKEVKRILKELRLKGETKMEPIQPRKTEAELRNEIRAMVNEKLKIETEKLKAETEKLRLETEKIKAENFGRLHNAMYWKHLADENMNDRYKHDLFIAYSTKEMAGEFVLQPPSEESAVAEITDDEATYSATEVGNMLGISANKVGSIANELKIKSPSYGKFFTQKARYSDKFVVVFRYNQKGIDNIKEYLSKQA